MTEHPGSDCAGGGARKRPVSGPGQPGCPGRPGHQRRRGPARSWVCAGGAAGPTAALTRSPGRRGVGRAWPVATAPYAGCWPGGQPGLPAAVLGRVRGSHIKVAVAWRRAQELGRLLMPRGGARRDAIPGPARDDRLAPAGCCASPAATRSRSCGMPIWAGAVRCRLVSDCAVTGMGLCGARFPLVTKGLGI
jgi:hypothetical protein